MTNTFIHAAVNCWGDLMIVRIIKEQGPGRLTHVYPRQSLQRKAFCTHPSSFLGTHRPTNPLPQSSTQPHTLRCTHLRCGQRHSPLKSWPLLLLDPHSGRLRWTLTMVHLLCTRFLSGLVFVHSESSINCQGE